MQQQNANIIRQGLNMSKKISITDQSNCFFLVKMILCNKYEVALPYTGKQYDRRE